MAWNTNDTTWQVVCLSMRFFFVLLYRDIKRKKIDENPFMTDSMGTVRKDYHTHTHTHTQRKPIMCLFICVQHSSYIDKTRTWYSFNIIKYYNVIIIHTKVGTSGSIHKQ